MLALLKQVFIQALPKHACGVAFVLGRTDHINFCPSVTFVPQAEDWLMPACSECDTPSDENTIRIGPELFALRIAEPDDTDDGEEGQEQVAGMKSSIGQTICEQELLTLFLSFYLSLSDRLPAGGTGSKGPHNYLSERLLHTFNDLTSSHPSETRLSAKHELLTDEGQPPKLSPPRVPLLLPSGLPELLNYSPLVMREATLLTLAASSMGAGEGSGSSAGSSSLGPVAQKATGATRKPPKRPDGSPKSASAAAKPKPAEKSRFG